jgi:predicted O-methyltransferase YrrM
MDTAPAKRDLMREFSDSWRWLRLSRHIDGWLSDREANALFLLARDNTPHESGHIVELGSWQGKSSVMLGGGLRNKCGAKLNCIDPFGIDENPEYQRLYYDGLITKMRHSVEEAFRRNIRRCGLADIVNQIRGYSFEVAKTWTEPIDMVFIDANHEYESVRRDFEMWSTFVKPGGIVALHDIAEQWPGPTRVMNEALQPPRFEEPQRVESLAWAVKVS